jgi:hypothetical protein
VVVEEQGQRVEMEVVAVRRLLLTVLVVVLVDILGLEVTGLEQEVPLPEAVVAVAAVLLIPLITVQAVAAVE